MPSYPLEVLDHHAEEAAAQLLEQALVRRLPGDRLAAVLTRIVLDGDDPAFARPSRPPVRC
jgi:carbamate kinase